MFRPALMPASGGVYDAQGYAEPSMPPFRVQLRAIARAAVYHDYLARAHCLCGEAGEQIADRACLV